MKYVALIRHLHSTGNWSTSPGSRVYRSKMFDTKEEAKAYLKETAEKAEKEYESFEGSKKMVETILVIDEVESENYEEFLEGTFY